MGFLDNSGDIILDAVLTDVGRRRMAQGNFRIVKFAMGDDEIDYTTYNPNHPSGSAYADLEILQTPILEAFTQQNANINYGLVSYARNDLLYLPTIAINRKMPNNVVYAGAQNVIYVADTSKFSGNENTYTLLTSTTAARSTVQNVLQGAQPERYVLIETGINNQEILPTAANQATYLLNVGLQDRQFAVGYDNRFIESVHGPAGNALVFTSPSSANSTATLSVSLDSPSAVTNARGIKNYSETPINGVVSKLYAPSSGTDNTSTYSEMTGPRGSATAVAFAMRQDLTTDHYTRFGSVNQDIFGLSDGITFDYIDTTVYVKGVTTNATVQIPLRITRVSP
jgi:hypothetical protein